MAVLFNNFEDFKPYIGSSNINFEIKTLDSYIQQAIDENIVPIVGQAFVDDTITKWKAVSSDADFKAVLPLFRSVIAQFSLMYWSLDSKLTIADTGLTRKENEQEKSAFKWQSDEFKQSKNEAGWQRIYKLVVYLETNVNNAGYALYKNSQERLWLTERLIWKLAEFNKVISIDSFETVVKLLPYLKRTEDGMMKESVTEGVLTLLKADPTSAQNKEPYLYAISTIVNHSIFKASAHLPFRITGKGIFVDSMEATTANSVKQAQPFGNIDQLKKDCEKAARESLSFLLEYLTANSSTTVFPTFYNTKVLPAVEAQETMQELRTQTWQGKKIPIL